MIAQTSMFAFKSLKDLGEKQRQVYDAIKELGTASNEQLADYLGWPINRITGRSTELRNFNMIEVAGIGRTKSGNSCKVWRHKVPDQDRILERLREH